MSRDDVTDAQPAYLALAGQLEALVSTLEPGDRLPSENELARRHGVSRITTRAALQELESRFLVRRVRGAGTFVSRRIDLPLGPDLPWSPSDAICRAGGVARRSVVSIRTRRPAAPVRNALDLDADERITSVAWTDSIDGEGPAAHGVAHLPVEVAPEVAEHLVDGFSLDGVLVDACSLAPSRLWALAELVPVPTEVAPRLDLDGGPLVWSLETCLHDPRLGRPVALSHTWLRPDLFRLVVELGRAD